MLPACLKAVPSWLIQNNGMKHIKVSETQYVVLNDDGSPMTPSQFYEFMADLNSKGEELVFKEENEKTEPIPNTEQ